MQMIQIAIGEKTATASSVPAASSHTQQFIGMAQEAPSQVRQLGRFQNNQEKKLSTIIFEQGTATAIIPNTTRTRPRRDKSCDRPECRTSAIVFSQRRILRPAWTK
ncbi:MAG: hypothetical protein WDN03_07730 [Rhizomicrobium sp.]